MLPRAGVPGNSARDLETSKRNDDDLAIAGTSTCCRGLQVFADEGSVVPIGRDPGYYSFSETFPFGEAY